MFNLSQHKPSSSTACASCANNTTEQRSNLDVDTVMSKIMGSYIYQLLREKLARMMPRRIISHISTAQGARWAAIIDLIIRKISTANHTVHLFLRFSESIQNVRP